MRRYLIFTLMMLIVPPVFAQAFTKEQLDEAKRQAEQRARDKDGIDLDGGPGALGNPASNTGRCVKYRGSGLGVLTGEAQCLQYEH